MVPFRRLVRECSGGCGLVDITRKNAAVATEYGTDARGRRFHGATLSCASGSTPRDARINNMEGKRRAYLQPPGKGDGEVSFLRTTTPDRTLPEVLSDGSGERIGGREPFKDCALRATVAFLP